MNNFKTMYGEWVTGLMTIRTRIAHNGKGGTEAMDIDILGHVNIHPTLTTRQVSTVFD